MTALLGLDVGERRVGVAIGDPGSGSVRPLATFARTSAGRDAAILRRLADEHGAAELVIGLPLDRDGGIGAQAEATRRWAAEVAPLVELPCSWRDERHTSQAAATRVGGPGRGRSGGPPSRATMRAHRSRLDREAAALIVQAEATRAGGWADDAAVRPMDAAVRPMTEPLGARRQRQGSVTARELRGDTRSRRTSGWGGVAFLGLLLLIIAAGGIVFLGPAYRQLTINLARDNPQALRLPFASDIVGDRMGGALREPAGTDDREIRFSVQPGDTIPETGAALTEAGFIRDPLVFTWHVMNRSLDDKLQAGDFDLAMTMTPLEIAQRLAQPPEPIQRQVVINLKVSLRLEQIAAYLQTLDLDMDVADFYALTQKPPRKIIDLYPFLKEIPEGRSLEGFMGRGTFSVDPDVSPEELLRVLLDRWQGDIGEDVIRQAKAKGLDFYDVVTLASIVERETGVDGERPKIAGVYLNRLDPRVGEGTELLGADPTVIYAVDTQKLRARQFTQWPRYVFWTRIEGSFRNARVPGDLKSFQTYQVPGLPNGPIATPTLPSIRAVIDPDRRGGFLYFLACPGEREHVFAKTLQEQQRNLNRCK